MIYKKLPLGANFHQDPRKFLVMDKVSQIKGCIKTQKLLINDEKSRLSTGPFP